MWERLRSTTFCIYGRRERVGALKAVCSIGVWSIESEIISRALDHQSISASRKHKIGGIWMYENHLRIVSYWRDPHLIGVTADNPCIVDIGSYRLSAGVKRQCSDDFGR